MKDLTQVTISIDNMCLKREFHPHAISTKCPSVHHLPNTVKDHSVSTLCLPLGKAAGYNVTLAQYAFNCLKQTDVSAPFYFCSVPGCEEAPTELRLMGQKIATLTLEKFAPEDQSREDGEEQDSVSDEDMEVDSSKRSRCKGEKIGNLAVGDSSGEKSSEEGSSEDDEESSREYMKLTVEMTAGNCNGEDRTFVRYIPANPSCADYGMMAWNRLTRQEEQQEVTSSQPDDNMSEEGSDHS